MAELTGIAKQVVEDYKAWTSYTQKDRRRWVNNWKLWNNQRVKRKYNAKTADSFDPMVHQVVESRVDNIYGSRPKATFVPTQPEQEKDTKLLSGMFDYSWEHANMDLEVISLGRENEIVGEMGVFTDWVDGCMTMTHIPFEDCVLDPTACRYEDLRFAGYKRLEMLDTLKNAMRFDPTKGEKDEDGNPTGEWVKAYKNLDKVKTWGELEDESDGKKLQQQLYAGSTLPKDDRKNQVQVIKMIYFDKVVELANQQIVIAEYPSRFSAPKRQVEVQLHSEDAEPMYDETQASPEVAQMSPEEAAQVVPPALTKITIPEIKPFLPFAFGRNFVRPNELLAKSTVDTIFDLQEDLNDEINIKKDNLIYRQQAVMLYDKNQPELARFLSQAGPGAAIPVDMAANGGESIKPMEKDQLAADSDVEINRIKQSIRDTARVDQVIQGTTSDNNRTATEINAQVSGASAGFTTQTRNLESGLYKQLGQQFLWMLQIFLTRSQIVRVLGKDGVEFAKFDPNKYFGEYDVKITLESAAKAQAQAQADTLIKGVEMVLNNPLTSTTVNPTDVARLVLQKVSGMDDDDIKLIMNPSPANTASQGGLPTSDVGSGGPALPPGAPPPPEQPSATAVSTPDGQVHESADLVKLYTVAPEDVKRQIEELLGFNPSEIGTTQGLQVAQDMAHKDVNLQMTAEKHKREMATPIEKPQPKVAAKK
jgi:hypothetical protein